MKPFIKNLFKIKLKYLVFYAFLILYGSIILYLAYKINISEDEAYTLNTTSRNIAGVIRQSYNFEGQPPVYFVLLSLWRHLYPGIFFVKLFSIILVGLSSYIFYRLVLLFSGAECSKWMVVIFLLNPFTIWAALEMRTYSLLLLLSSISIYFFYRYFFENKNKFLYLFLLTAVIGIYTQYFFTFLIASLAFSILVFKGWKEFLRLSLYLVPVVLLFLPNLLFLPDQIKVHESHGGTQYSLSSIFSVLHTPQNFLLAIYLLPDTWPNRIVRIIFFFFAVYSIIKLYKNYFSQSDFYLRGYNIILFCILLLLFFFSIGIYITDVVYTYKYMVVAFPFFMLFFAIFKIHTPLLRRLTYSALSIYFIALLIPFYKHPVKTYDYISIANYIRKIEVPNEPILIYRPAIALPFSYCYNGNNKIVPLPYPVNFDSSFLINIRDTIELKQSISNIKSTSQSYLLISDTTVYESKLSMNRTMVSDYINNHFHVTLDTLFYGWSKEKPLRIISFRKLD